MNHSMFNAFDILKLKIDFDINLKSLEQVYFHAMQTAHPDQHLAKSLQHKVHSHEDASLINQAYRVLKDPLLRAQHCLQLQGISSIKFSQSLTSQNILVESMTLRESLEDAHTPEDVENLLKCVQSKKENLLSALTLAFKKSDMSEAYQLTEHFGYLNKFQNEAQAKMWALEETDLLMENTHASSAA